MVKRITAFVSTGLLSIAICLGALSPGIARASAVFSHGDGTTENPYKISNCDQLQAIASNLEAHYKLVSNIDCDSNDFVHIGDGDTPFSGTLDGNYKIVKDLNVDDFGLFGTIHNGTVQNLLFKNPYVSGSSNVGILAGTVLGGGTTITNIHVLNGTVTASSNYIGGMVGTIGLDNPVLEKSSFTGSVSSPGVMGGFVGNATSGAYIQNNYVRATLTVGPDDSPMVGGFIGIAAASQIANNYAITTIDASNGGFNSTVGGFGGLGSGWIQSSFADMTYNTGADQLGDFLGYAAGLTVNANYYASHGHQWASNTNAGGGVTAVDTGTDPTYFYTQLDHPPLTYWDFENTWEEVENDYPRLRGEAGFSEASSDINGDSVNDSYQANVIGVPDGEANLTVVELAGDSDCTLDPDGSWIDAGYFKEDPDFPLQIPKMTQFTVYCPTAGSQVVVTLVYPEQYDTSKSVIRFYDDVANEYHTVSGVTFGTRTVNGNTVTTATYTLVDGGVNDTDGTEDAVIHDPVGIAVDNSPGNNSSSGNQESGNSSGNGSTVQQSGKGLAQTGQSTTLVNFAATLALTLGIASLLIARFKVPKGSS